MNEGEFLRKLIIGRFNTISEFSRFVGIPRTTVYAILNNVGGTSIQHIIKICAALNISVDELANYGKNNHIEEKFTNAEKKAILNSVDTYDYIPYTSDLTAKYVVPRRKEGYRKLPIPNTMLGRYAGDKEILFMHMTGDSMNKVIEDGALIAVKRGVKLHDLNDKDIVLVANNEDLYVKVFFFDEKNRLLLLKPLSNNPFHIPLVKPIDEGSAIIGKVVAFNVIV